MSRKLHWRRELAAYLRQCSAEPFRPGTLDCGLFVGGAVAAMTGQSVTDGLHYKTIKAGLSQMKRKGFADHIEYAASLFEEWPSPLFAQEGDIAALEGEDGSPVLGVVQGEGIYVMGIDGLGIVPLTDAKRAFKV